jgi:hypothetical protein
LCLKLEVLTNHKSTNPNPIGVNVHNIAYDKTHFSKTYFVHNYIKLILVQVY